VRFPHSILVVFVFGCGSVSDSTPDAAVLADASIDAPMNSPDAASVNPGMALRFDGTDDLATIAHDASLDFSLGTIEGWVNLTDESSGALASMWGQGGLADKIMLRFLNGEASALIVRVGVAGQSQVASAVPANQWTHVATVYDGTNLVLYINGVEEASVAAPGTLPTPVLDLELGVQAITGAGQTFLSGDVDEVRIWSVVRSAAEIAANYDKEVSAATNGLVAYYKFNGTGQVVVDSSASGNNGALGTGPADEAADPERVVSLAPLTD